jgi:ABC-2 type transport system permease protein
MRTTHDTWLIFERSLVLSLRNPVWVIMGIIQPVLYLLLFGPLLTNIARMPGFPPGGAFNVFVPGILVMTALFGAAFVGRPAARRCCWAGRCATSPCFWPRP